MARLHAAVHRFSSLPSTNQKAIEFARAGAPEGTTVIAQEQTAGRGRLDRKWFSPRGQGLYHSIILRPPILPEGAPILTLLVAVALQETLRSGYGVRADIKWPNDILIHNRKCAGILLDMQSDGGRVDFVVVGIGINLNQREFPPEMADGATSILLEAGRGCEPEEIRQRLFDLIDAYYQVYEQAGPEWVIKQWIERSSFAHGRQVRVDLGQRKFSGTTCGLREDGALLVKTEEGTIEPVLAGDIIHIM